LKNLNSTKPTKKDVISMIYSPTIKNAMIIALLAHGTQFDRGGYPYFHHPLHLAEQMDDEYTCAAAILHDVIEDGKCTAEHLRECHIPEPVIEAVKLLTRPHELTYMEYIRRLKKNEIARKVKIADLKHNLDTTRLKEPPTERFNLRLALYRKALRELEAVSEDNTTSKSEAKQPDEAEKPQAAGESFYGMAVSNEVLLAIAKAAGRSVVDVRNEWSNAKGDFVTLPNGIDVIPVHLSPRWCENIVFDPIDTLNGTGVEKECEFFLKAMRQPSIYFAAYASAEAVVKEFRNAIEAYIEDPHAKDDWWWKSRIGFVQCAIYPRD
jgi:hypothetical protein